MVGLHERDPLLAAMKDYSLTPFAGRLFFAFALLTGEHMYRTLDGRVPYVEAADTVSALAVTCLLEDAHRGSGKTLHSRRVYRRCLTRHRTER